VGEAAAVPNRCGVGGQEDMIIDVALALLDERERGVAPEQVTDDRAGIDALAAGAAL
jgi:hypothetical protein